MNETQLLQACETHRSSLQSKASFPHRILVVEDDPLIRQLNTETLLQAGYEVDAAADGAAAWQALNAETYDLLITDNNMPNLSGIELLKRLRTAHLELPFIMATGTLPQEEFDRRPWLQPAVTLVKPHTLEELLGAVKKVLGQAETSPQEVRPPRPRDLDGNQIAPASQPGVMARAGREPSANRILVVDEDRDLRQLYTEALTEKGYAVDVAEDGAVGWQALQAKPYDLLITEHEIPKLTGMELVRNLRAAHMALPVVMAAARLPTDELARQPSLQLAATLFKPFALGVLLNTVNKILRPPIRTGHG